MSTRPPFRCWDCKRPARRQVVLDADPPITVAACLDCGPSGFTSLPRVGRPMLTCCFVVVSEPGLSASKIAGQIYDPPNTKQGFKVIARARIAGLIDRVERTDHLEFYLTDLGRCIYGTEQ